LCLCTALGIAALAGNLPVAGADERAAAESTATLLRAVPLDAGQLVLGEGIHAGLRSFNVSPAAVALANRTPDEVRGRDPGASAVRVAAATSEETATDMQNRLSARYGNPAVTRLAQRLTADKALAVYYETAQLIDARHVSPATYEARTKRALDNLSLAMENPKFLQANRIAPTPAKIKQFRDSLEWLATNRPAKTSGDALNTVRWTMDLGNRIVGLSPSSVALDPMRVCWLPVPGSKNLKAKSWASASKSSRMMRG
jgi:hypothetical protein